MTAVLTAPGHPGLRRVPALVAGLAAFGERTSLVSGDRRLTFAELAREVDGVARDLGPERRLVLVVADLGLDCVLTYLGALAGGHAVMLVPGDSPTHVRAWTERYDPDVVARADGDRWQVTVRRPGTAHDLHPDLALLMTTSGSTGSPKLVRLSYDGLDANTDAIAEALAISDDDRAVTTLPLAYCYGLSVLHSHLRQGAATVLTRLSVVDDCFWDLCRAEGVTSVAGVPYTFTLLERIGFGPQHLPTLRRLTQAGGALPPEQVRRFAATAAGQGAAFHVMYGQTEATARMAVLPPELAASRPGSIGRAVPGGALHVADPDDDGVGELVYRGANVMLGYAHGPEDLGRGRDVHDLRTGDLARQDADGLFEIVGRSARIAKVCGLRVDLGAVEQRLCAAGLTTWCTGSQECLVVLAEDARASLAAEAAAAAGIPVRSVRVVGVDALPRTERGKVDVAAATALADAPPLPTVVPSGGSRRERVLALYSEILGAPATDASTFVGLGGDSLSYAELALRLEDEIGRLPAGWPSLSVAALCATDPAPVRRSFRVDTTVLLRAVAIVLIVGSHAKVFHLVGGAHALVAVAGYNYARFRLTGVPLGERLRGTLRSARRIAVPSVVLIAAATVTTPALGWAQVALLNSVYGPETFGPQWRYWFVEALVHLLLGAAVLMALPALDRLERRRPLVPPVVLVGLGLLTRFEILDLGRGPDEIEAAAGLVWLFALGWWAARAVRHRQRLAVSAVVLASVPGFFGDLSRESVIVAAILLLLWLPEVTLPSALRLVRPVLATLAASSLYIYLTHWQVMDLLAASPWAVLLGSLAVGVGTTRLVDRAGTWWRGRGLQPQR